MIEHISNHNLGMYAKGNPHIAYSSDNLYYAWSDDTDCLIQTVIVDDVNSYIALDSEGFPIISYSVGFGNLMFDSDYPEKEMPTTRPPIEPIPTEASPTITPEPGDDNKLFLPLTMRN